MNCRRLCLALVAGLFFMSASHSADARSYMGIARSHFGTNPTGWSRQWCAKWIDMVLRQSGRVGGGNRAIGYKSYGRPTRCRVGALAVMKTHIGFVTACHGDSVTIISGNHSGSPGRRTVGLGRYRMSRIVAFRMP